MIDHLELGLYKGAYVNRTPYTAHPVIVADIPADLKGDFDDIGRPITEPAKAWLEGLCRVRAMRNTVFSGSYMAMPYLTADLEIRTRLAKVIAPFRKKFSHEQVAAFMGTTPEEIPLAQSWNDLPVAITDQIDHRSPLTVRGGVMEDIAKKRRITIKMPSTTGKRVGYGYYTNLLNLFKPS